MSNTWACVAPHSYYLDTLLGEAKEAVLFCLEAVYPSRDGYSISHGVPGWVQPDILGSYVWSVKDKGGVGVQCLWLNQRGDLESEHKYQNGDPDGSVNRDRLIVRLCRKLDLRPYDSEIGWQTLENLQNAIRPRSEESGA